MIRVEGLFHRFGALEVLRDVNFEVPKGHIFGFVGPNGAGKTTTLRMMATLAEPQRGTITVDGLDVVTHPSEVRKIIGFMPDAFGVYERVTVVEYLEFFAAAHGLERGARRRTIEAVVELTGLGSLRERLVSTMSKGMRQRLAIARMLLHDPRVLILDEPANGLDPRARVDMRELIEELQRLGKTIVISSHILSDLGEMCTSVVILEKGTVRATGLIRELGRQVQAERAVRIRLLDPNADPTAVLQGIPGVVRATRPSEGLIHVAYDGGDDIVASLVAALVRDGMGVIGVEPEENNLEKVFLELTKGELQ